MLDRSSAKHIAQTKLAAILKFHTEHLGLSDPWRTRFPYHKEFSFFYHVHHSFSWIDFFILDNKLLHSTVAWEYHSIVISDHAPTSVDITFYFCRPAHKFWKLISQLLAEAKFKEFLMEQIIFSLKLMTCPKQQWCTVRISPPTDHFICIPF